jgi:hypothetical protein
LTAAATGRAPDDAGIKQDTALDAVARLRERAAACMSIGVACVYRADGRFGTALIATAAALARLRLD